MPASDRWKPLALGNPLADRNLYMDPNMLGTAVKLPIGASDVADGSVDGADPVVVLGRDGGTIKPLRRTVFTVMLMAGALPSFSACASMTTAMNQTKLTDFATRFRPAGRSSRAP